MPNYKITDNITGKSMVINHPKPPSDDEVGHIFDTYYEGKDKINQIKPVYSGMADKLASHIPQSIVDAVGDTFEPYNPHPVDNAKTIGQGFSSVVDDPIGGVTKVLKGTAGELSPYVNAIAAPVSFPLNAASAIGKQLTKGRPTLIPGQETTQVDPNSLRGKVGALGQAAGDFVMAGMPHAGEVPIPPVEAPPEPTSVAPYQPQEYNINTYEAPPIQDLTQKALPPGPIQAPGRQAGTQPLLNNRTSGIPMESHGREYPTVTAPENIYQFTDVQAPTDPYGIGNPSAQATARFNNADNPALAVQAPEPSPIVAPNDINGIKVQPPAQPEQPLPFRQVEDTPIVKAPEPQIQPTDLSQLPQKTVEQSVAENYPEVKSPIIKPEGSDAIGERKINPEIIQPKVSNPEVKQPEAQPNAEATIPEQKAEIKTDQPEVKVPTNTEGKVTENPYKDFSLEALTKLLENVKNPKSIEQIKAAIEGKANEQEPEEVTNESASENGNAREDESNTTKVEEPSANGNKKVDTAYTRALAALDVDSMESASQSHLAIRNGLIDGIPTNKILEDLIKKGMDDKVAKRQITKEQASYNSQKGSLAVGEIGSDVKEMGSKVSKSARSILETTHEFLKSSGNEIAKRIGEVIPYNYDQERKWIGNFKDELRQPLKDLSNEEKEQVAKVLDGVEQAKSDKIRQASDQIRTALNKAMDFFEQRQSETGVGFRANGNRMGRLDDYLTHIKAEAPKDIWDGIKDSIGNLYKEGDITTEESLHEAKGVKNPKSGFAESRSTRDNPISYDLDKVLGTYAESMGRVAWRKPITDILGEDINDLPDGRLKDVARNYIKQYAGIQEKGLLTDAARTLMNVDSRSRMLLNPRLWALHAGRLSILAGQHDLPIKYFASGAKAAMANPLENFQKAVTDGLVPGYETGPRLFESKGQKLNKWASAYNIADAIPDMVAREAYKQKFIDEGKSPEVADNLAITAAKNSTLRIDPVRQSELFSKMSNDLYGLPKLAGQYKQTQFKIVEQYIRNSAKLFSNDLTPGEKAGLLGRLVGSTATALYVTNKLGVPVFHYNKAAFSLLNVPVVDEWARIGKKLYDGISGDESKLKQGVMDFLTYITPAGRSQIKPLIETGKPKIFGEVGQQDKGKSMEDYFPVSAP